MTVLVTGGSGFIGSHVVDELVQQGYSVRVFDKIKPLRDDVEWFNGDLQNVSDIVLSCRDVETIFHLGAIADVYIGLANPTLCMAINEMGTLNLLTAITPTEIDRLVLASTSWVYGNVQGEVDETSPIPLPDHIYTKTKIGQEHLVYNWAKHHGLSYTILRYGIPYGPRMRSNLVLAIFISRVMTGKPITIFGDGEQGRCFIYIKDLAEGNVAALSPQGNNQIINIAGSEFITINDIVTHLQAIFGPIEVKHQPARPGDFRGITINIDKARRLGWMPRTPFVEGLKHTVEYFQQQAYVT